jgi:porphobilinogen synthase
MSFSSLVQDLSFKDNANDRRQLARGSSSASTMDDRRSHISRAMSYASTAATSVSISGDIASQLHGGYCHPLARSWQAERQLTKVRAAFLTKVSRPLILPLVNAYISSLHL